MSLRTDKRGIDMKERITIRKKGQITLPKDFMEKFHLAEGDSLELEVTEDGEVEITPMMQIPASQRWFWTDEWQKGEKEANEDIKAGNVKSFDDVDSAIKWLDSDDAESWSNED